MNKCKFLFILLFLAVSIKLIGEDSIYTDIELFTSGSLGKTMIETKGIRPKDVTSLRIRGTYLNENDFTLIKEKMPQLRNLDISDVENDVIPDEWLSQNCVIEFVSLPKTLKTVPYKCFENCTRLQRVKFGNKLVSISNLAFKYCTYLDSVEIPSSTKFINAQAFANCWCLSEINIPKSIESIGGLAFDDCRSLKRIHIKDLDSWFKIDFGNQFSNPLNNGGSLYINNKRIDNIIIPEGVKNIGHELYGCRFFSLTIPSTVTSIKQNAFGDSHSKCIVTDIYMYNIIPPHIEESIYGIDLNNVILHVLSEARTEYMLSNFWSDFIIIKPITIIR